MKKKLLLFLVMLSIKFVAQNDVKIFYGKINDELGSLSNAHIINLNTNVATFSNDNGEFKISAKINDSLKFTSVGYKTKILIIKPVHLGIQETKIILQKEVYELDEIELKSHNLIGSLSSDIKNIKHGKRIDAKTLNLPNSNRRKFTVAERRLYTAKGGNNLLSLDYLLNTISGRIKKLKKFKTIEDQEVEVNYLKETYKDHILKEFNIDSLKIYSFIYYTLEDANYKEFKAKGTFQLIEFLKKKSIEFNNLK